MHLRSTHVRLEFAQANNHDAQLYQCPMNRWVVIIEEHPIAFDLAPWVNYQGEIYMGQKGSHYQVTIKPKSVDRLVQLVTV